MNSHKKIASHIGMKFGVPTGVSMKTINLMVSMVFLGILIFVSVANAQTDPAIKDREQCTSEKLRAAAQYLACRLLQADQSKCDNKISQEFDRAEKKYGSACPTRGDVSDFIQQHIPITDRILLQLTGVRYVDNGDGTVTDNQTGLMWEKTAGIVGTNTGNLNDVNNTYAWAAAWTALNGVSDGYTITGCFANYCDWRLPSVTEFRGILNLSQEGCGTDTGSCIDPIFGPTQLGYAMYWTATTADWNPDNVWSVMGYGQLYNLNKTSNSLYVRAVRSGSCR